MTAAKGSSDALAQILRSAQPLGEALLEELPPPVKRRRETEIGRTPYIVPPALEKAAVVALMLGQPLLLTGDPGVGKSAFAGELAHRLGLGQAETIVVRSTSTGRELLYTFDDVARFRDASWSAPELLGKDGAGRRVRPLARYVRLGALGLAIVRAAGPEAVISPRGDYTAADIIGPTAGQTPQLRLRDLFPDAFPLAASTARGPCRTVVLVDEIDKAPRDAPNDLLDEIESMHFDIPELGIPHIKADPKHWPIVVITSNSERNLPTAFLRRCYFHHLIMPGDPQLTEIVLSHVSGTRLSRSCKLMDGLLRIFRGLHARSEIEKKPSTAELIAAAFLLTDLGFDAGEPPWTQGNLWVSCREQLAATLCKNSNDHSRGLAVIEKLSGSVTPASKG